MSSSNGSITASRSNGAGSGGYSARVRLSLRVGDSHIPVAQVGGDRLYFDAPVLLPPGTAEVIVDIDGQAKSRAIRLPERSEPARVWEYSTL